MWYSYVYIFYLFQIKLLQNELQKNHFKITEERKIVSEIDKLNRSKRAVKEINSVKVCTIYKTYYHMTNIKVIIT